MKKLLIGIAFFNLLSTTLFAQKNTLTHCSTSEKMAHYYKSLSSFEKIQFDQHHKAYEAAIKQFIQKNHAQIYSKTAQKSIKYTIPVVFHVLYDDKVSNISEEQIKDALHQLNKDFQALNSDLVNTIDYFQPITANIQIEFKLAKLDPNGNCTNGITRTYSPVSSSGIEEEQLLAIQNVHGIWPGNQYLNIFVCHNIGGSAGYTRIPFYGNTGMNNGIYILFDYCGGIGASTSYRRHSLSHEVGHWLNLLHTWGSTNSPGNNSNCDEDDGVDDTPNTKGWVSCDLQGKTCQNDPSTFDNVQNFMDYSYCSTMFTEGQKARMWAALENATGGRNNIVSASNLMLTGVEGTSNVCGIDFSASKRVICMGEEVLFSEIVPSASTTYSWQFQGAYPSSSTVQSPSVTYSSPGLYTVKLTTENGVASSSKVKVAYIKVLGSPKQLPFSEGFENIDSLNLSDWSVKNQGNNAGFHLTTECSYNGTKAIKIENFGQNADNVDALLSPPIDLSSADATEGVSLTFRYAYRKQALMNDEKVRILFSKDCGSNWILGATLNGGMLGNNIATDDWVPTTQPEWGSMAITNISPAFYVDNFRVKFEFLSDGGNNFYLDDINIIKGIPEDLATVKQRKIKLLNVYPNPANSHVKVDFSLPRSAEAKVTILTLTGKTLLQQNIQANAGRNSIQLNTQGIAAGFYIIKLRVDDTVQIKRLVIER